jgi:hypothetical protein
VNRKTETELSPAGFTGQASLRLRSWHSKQGGGITFGSAAPYTTYTKKDAVEGLGLAEKIGGLVKQRL